MKDVDPAMATPLTGITVPKEKEDRKTGVPWVPLLLGNRGAGRVAEYPEANGGK